ncbi:hypothetical protein ACROYT_G032089 [Oculina patagonica]
MAAPFDFQSWCETNGLKKETSELLTKQDLDTKEALALVTESDVASLEMTLGQRKLLVKAITGLRKGSNATLLDPDPVTTKSLAKDGGLDEILKKIEGIGAIDDPLLTLGATETPLPRLDNDPQVFLGTSAKAAQGAKGGEKPLLITDFVSVNNLASNEEEQEISSSGGASIVIRAQKGKPKLENITLSMWIAANARIMHELLTTGKLSGTPSIADYLSYTVKFAELLESHTFLSALLYDNEYRKLQHKYGFSSPLNLEAWRTYLHDDSDMEFILNGIANGFHFISPDAIVTPAEVPNYRSATSTDVRDKVERQIRDEIQMGNYGN